MSESSEAVWKNRIVGHGEEDPRGILENPRNWRIHTEAQVELLERSLARLGWVQDVVVNRRTGRLIDGHARVRLAVKHGIDRVPVVYVDLSEEEEAAALALLDPISAMAETDAPRFLSLLADAVGADILDEEEAHMLMESVEALPVPFDEDDLHHDEDRPNPRKAPLDAIYTLDGADGSCCIAVKAGFRYGVRSKSYRLCGNTHLFSGHSVAFVDNDFRAYDHETHLRVVKDLRPKYATVRDIMTRTQCASAGIEYYPVEQILDWAEELAEYAENVIVIPKFDVVHKIPDKFVLGYSIPTSYGGTPLPLEAFKGRRVHLLGGSWEKQRRALSLLGDDVVSIDLNYVHLLALKGIAVLPGGETRQIRELGLDFPIANPFFVAIAISLGVIMSEIQEVTGEKGETRSCQAQPTW